jgi:hypothetical protein
VTLLRMLALLGALAACSSRSASPPALPSVAGASVTSVRPARALCSGTPPASTAPTARHAILSPSSVGDLRRTPDTDQTRQLNREYEAGLVGSGQSLKLLAEYAGGSANVKVSVLSTAPGSYGQARLAFLCRSASGYLAANVTALSVPGFTDDLQCFETPSSTKPVRCAWYDDTAGTLTITGVKGTKALALAVALRTGVEKPLTG